MSPEWKPEIQNTVIPKAVLNLQNHCSSDENCEALVAGTRKLEGFTEEIIQIGYEASSGKSEAELNNFHRIIHPPPSEEGTILLFLIKISSNYIF